MKAPLVISSALIIQVLGAPIQDDARARIDKYVNKDDGKGDYEFSFKTSNGIFRRELGTLINTGEQDAYYEVYGEFSYNDPDGNLVVVHYSAGKDGYQIVDPIPDLTDKIVTNGHVVATLLG